MNITIKRILKFDRALINELMRKSGEHRGVPNHAFFKSKENILHVAFRGKETAGYSWSYVLHHPDRPRPALFLYSIDVFGLYLRQGVGSQLISEIKKLARRLKCFEIFVLTEKTNRRALRFYESTGARREKPDSVMFVYTPR